MRMEYALLVMETLCQWGAKFKAKPLSPRICDILSLKKHF